MVSIMDRREKQIGGDGMPWQIKAIIMLGVPSVIALFLVYIFAFKLVTQVEALPHIEGKVDASIEAIKELTKAIKESTVEDHKHGERLERLIQIGCVRESRTERDRLDCLKVQ
jgi:hypothetical protein